MFASEKKLVDPLSQQKNNVLVPLVIVAFSASNRSSLLKLTAGLHNKTCHFSWLFLQSDIVENGDVGQTFFSKQIGLSVQALEENETIKKNTFYILEPGIRFNGPAASLIDPKIHYDATIFHADSTVYDVARYYRHRTIYILLSGPSRDGIHALAHVKNQGGLVLAEAVEHQSQAHYNRYVQTYCDTILPAAQMMPIIERLIAHPFIFGNGQQLKNSIDENDQSIDYVIELIKNNLDIDLQQYNARIIASSLERRMAINGMLSIDQYTALLASSEKELNSLYKKISVGLVKFFSHELATDLVCQEIITAVQQTDPMVESITIWVAGCRTGQEAYTLAILFDEICCAHHLPYNIIIKATDISAQSIEYASRGWYPQEISEEVSVSRLAHYFEKENHGYRVKSWLQQKIQFIQHDLFNDPPYKNIDLISCGNNMRVFQPKVQKKILSSFFYALKEERFLLLGADDSLGELQSHFEHYDLLENFYIKTSNHVVPIGSLPPLQHSKKQSSSRANKNNQTALAITDSPSASKIDKSKYSTIAYLRLTEHVLRSQGIGLVIVNSQHTLLRISALVERVLEISETDVGTTLTQDSSETRGYKTLYLNLHKPHADKHTGMLFYGRDDQQQASWEIFHGDNISGLREDLIVVMLKLDQDVNKT